VDWLSSLLSLGRVLGRKRDRSGGRFLPPAPFRRAHLEIADVDFKAGAVRLLSGEWRAVAKVTGYPTRSRGAEEVLAFLRGYAAALNALPSSVVLLSRSRPGGLEGYAAERRVRRAQPGTPAPLARLLADQEHRALERMREGAVRQTGQFLVVRAKTAEEAGALLDRVARQLGRAGVQVSRVTNRELVRAIAESWSLRTVEHFVEDFTGPRGDVVASLVYRQGGAGVTTPRYGPSGAPAGAPSASPPAGPPRAPRP
jgi:hypothetical protein